MFLKKKTYIGNQYKDPNDMIEIKIPLNKQLQVLEKRFENIKKEKISEITETIGQWRKAQTIHNWFVNNIQGGEDDCREYIVDSYNLEKLLKICENVKKNPKMAHKFLKVDNYTKFDETIYDQYYFQDIEDTIKILKEAIIEAQNADIYYSSSW